MRWWRRMTMVTLLALANAAWAQTADEAWDAVAKFDAGPELAAASAAEMERGIKEHFARQEKSLRSFIANHSGDERVSGAKFRLVHLLSERSRLEREPRLQKEAQGILAAMEREASPQEKATINFVRLTLVMRQWSQPGAGQRDEILRAVRDFQKRFPGDARRAAALAEVATLFDDDPKLKRALIAEVLRMQPGEDLRLRVEDDLKRLNLLGKPLELKPLGGKSPGRGPVAVVFFAAWSPAAMAKLEEITVWQKRYPGLRVVGVSLDEDPASAARVKESTGWSIFHDGRGWESPVVRQLGVNALPTVWVLDADGIVRSIGTREAEPTLKRLVK